MCKSKSARSGFTLVEILIVVIILGILAAIIIPQFANASSDARVTNLKTSLTNVRNQIEVFKCQHNDTAPALAGMWSLLTGQTDTSEANSAAPTGTHWGPYLQAAPVNPLNGQSSVTSAAVDVNAGWYYQPAGLGFTFYSRNADGSVNTAY
jgi:prepilin-type N-terminal cleavage/methylation domain-containing protein